MATHAQAQSFCWRFDGYEYFVPEKDTVELNLSTDQLPQAMRSVEKESHAFKNYKDLRAFYYERKHDPRALIALLMWDVSLSYWPYFALADQAADEAVIDGEK